MGSIGANEAQASFAELLRRVSSDRERVVIERRGKPAAILTPIEGPDQSGGGGEQATRDKATLFEETERLAKLGHWEWDEVEDRCTYCSRELARLHGVTVEAFLERSSSLDGDLSWIHPDDRAAFKPLAEDIKRLGRGYDIEYRLLQPDGSWIEVREVAEAVLDDAGAVIRSHGFVQDITERKKAEATLEQTQALLKKAMQTARMGVWVWDDAKNECVHCSEELAQLFGQSVEEYLATRSKGAGISAAIHPEDRARYVAAIDNAVAAGGRYQVVFREKVADGTYRDFLEVGEPLEKGGSQLPASIGIVQDITGLKDTERALQRAREELERRVEERTSELQKKSAQLQSIMDHSPASIFVRDAEGCYELVNREFETTFGVSNESIKGALAEDALPPGFAGISHTQGLEVLRTGLPSTSEETFEIGGRRRTLLSSTFPILDSAGQPTGVGTISTDITEHKEAEAKVRANEARLSQAVELAGLGHWVWDALDDRCLFCSEENARIHGMSVNDYIANASAIDGAFSMVHPDDREEVKATYRELRRGQAIETEYRLLTPAGEVRYVHEIAKPVLGEDGGVIREFGTIQDITKVRRVEEEVRLRDAQLRAILENSPIEIVLKDTEARGIAISRNVSELLGYECPEQMVGGTAVDVLPEQIGKIYLAADKQVLATGKALQSEVREEVDGVVRFSLSQKFPMRDEQGRITGICSMTTDITEMKEAEARLAQAQKMEAVGQLTGGVAHDFNNLLAVIRGNAEFLTDQVGDQNAFIQAIESASARGAELTQRLLAFSRRQPLRSRPTDLVALVRGMRELLQRTLGETIKVNSVATESLAFALVDPGQTENVLLNLALNARDAMPGGGELTIECYDARLDESYVARDPEAVAGDYVVLAVSDTGEGMSPEAQKRAFEPFFTTKDVGEGSGLGLSMVYGFAKQSGGHINIYSEEGLGTTVKLYLVPAESASRPIEDRPAGESPKGRGETVLLIEDDREVRALGRAMLVGLGYRVVEAADAPQARSALSREGRIDLVLSDVVLPGGTSGPEFADELRGRHPRLPVIFMSGYPAEAASRKGILGSDRVLLNKPFERRELAVALREALGGRLPD